MVMSKTTAPKRSNDAGGRWPGLWLFGTKLLLLSLAACSGALAVSDVRRLDQQGDVDGLIAAWKRGPPVSVAPDLLDALAHHPTDPRSQSTVASAARRHPNPEVRRHAVSVLPRFQDPRADGALIAALGDAVPSVRTQARGALAQRGDAAFDPLLEAGRSDANPLIRAACLDLLVQLALKNPARKDAVAGVLEDRGRRDDGPVVRAAAASGLGALDVTSARPLLRQLAKTDDDAQARAAARSALGRLSAPTADDLKVVAVLPLKNDTGDPKFDRYGEQVADLLSAELSAAAVCEVVDQARRDAAIAELRKSGSLLYDGDRPNAPQLGKFALAEQLVYGTIQRTGTVYTVVINRMDVATLALIRGASVSVRGYRADLDRMKVEATRKFVDRFR